MTPHGVLRPHSQNHSHHAWLVLECPRFGSTHRPGFFNHDSDGVLMIKAVSFDFYNTLVRFWPPLEEIQRAACHELGLTVREDAITHGCLRPGSSPGRFFVRHARPDRPDRVR